MKAAPIALSVTVYDGVVPVLLVAGIPGHREEVGFLLDGPHVRTLRPTRGIPARLPERPMVPGQSSLAAILRRSATVAADLPAD
ncbi:hypothetical protein [Azospirillum agricola]|uniref:hypothetical protein n=1 Tax=Azospirillum agricola TaxID=1720247 RepID=UPI000A0F13B4|nr:hypothetical protein [Azospirillum agricola]SMH62863.1 hypothetical protein SAMN02982994_6686 [Azospirillum lipoferum]